jgi:hypothetical protein
MKELTFLQKLVLSFVGAAVGIAVIAGGYVTTYKLVTLIGAR